MIEYADFEELELLGEYLVEILSSALHQEKAPELPLALTWEKVYEFAESHGTETLAFYGAQPYIKELPELYKRWKRSCDRNLIQSVMQKTERETLYSEFAERGISFLPLKGCELKELYPREEFRQMSDLDILIQPQDAEQVREMMEELGYATDEFGETNHDEYGKPPYLMVEIHRQMLPDGDERQEYFKHIWGKAVQDEGNPYRWKMKPEDFYIYHLAHLKKHLEFLGSGIRPLMDTVIFLEKYESRFDNDYLDRELKKLELEEFRKDIENLSRQLFQGKRQAISEKENENRKKLKLELFVSGVYGDWSSLLVRRLWSSAESRSMKDRVKYVWERIFMKRTDMEYSYPVLKKHPGLLPFCWIYRIFYILLFKRNAIQKEWKWFGKKRK